MNRMTGHFTRLNIRIIFFLLVFITLPLASTYAGLGVKNQKFPSPGSPVSSTEQHDEVKLSVEESNTQKMTKRQLVKEVLKFRKSQKKINIDQWKKEGSSLLESPLDSHKQEGVQDKSSGIWGFLSFIFGALSFLGQVGLILSVFAIIAGLIGIQDGRKMKWLAYVGLILVAVALALAVLSFI